ncbi:nucleotidyltransferase domain-containing protein [bacterium D16-51]|nr:nucleotidyltransferase domain-containing protein [bacterium D16-59]RKI59627.1 nucleotidyltransferase domain-containing protein [bacterium D16-51]
MEVDEIIEKTKQICKANGVKKLSLFGSFAKGNAAFTSDIDFVVYGCKNLEKLEKDLEQIDTLRKIDIFEFENIKDKFLLEDIENYEKQIYETL